MSDTFEQFLASSLTPAERPADRRFITAVGLRIELEEHLERQRRQLLASLGTQLIALLAVAAGLLWLVRAAPISRWAAGFPGLALGMLIVAFASLVTLFARRPAAAIDIPAVF